MDITNNSVKKLPDKPGVYFFLDDDDKVLYVGKATSLKSRVRSYFSKNLIKSRGVHMVSMVEKARKVDFKITASVLEALILEANFIKEFKPPYNTRDKDDKSFNYIVFTMNEDFPRLLTVRGRDLSAKIAQLKLGSMALTYGPFTNAGQLRDALKIIRKIFPYYDTKKPVALLREKKDYRLLFNESICVYPKGSITKKEYARTVRHLKTLFDGKMKKLARSLEKEMALYAKKEMFEEASVVKKQLFALQHIEDVSLLHRESESTARFGYRIEAYDVAHLSGTSTVGVMVVLKDGEVNKKEYRTFNIKKARKGSDTGALREMLERRFDHTEWQYPRLVVLDGGIAQMNVAKKVFKEFGIDIPIVAVTKDERHKPVKLQGNIKIKNKYQNEILLANAEAHRFALAVHKKKRSKKMLQ